MTLRGKYDLIGSFSTIKIRSHVFLTRICKIVANIKNNIITNKLYISNNIFFWNTFRTDFILISFFFHVYFLIYLIMYNLAYCECILLLMKS